MVQAQNTPTASSVLQVLKADRLVAVGRDLEIAVDVTSKRGKDVLIGKLTGHGLELPRLLRVLGRDELREACRAHNIPDDSRSRTELAQRLLASRSPQSQTRATCSSSASTRGKRMLFSL